jgi:hypothetical protein
MVFLYTALIFFGSSIIVVTSRKTAKFFLFKNIFCVYFFCKFYVANSGCPLADGKRIAIGIIVSPAELSASGLEHIHSLSSQFFVR